MVIHLIGLGIMALLLPVSFEQASIRVVVKMTLNSAEFQDIFHGAEKIEIFGKLPLYLWTYIEAGRKLVSNPDADPTIVEEALEGLGKLLSIINSAAEHLGNKELVSRLSGHSEMLEQFQAGYASNTGFLLTFETCLKELEVMAGPRRETPEGYLFNAMLDRDMQKTEHIKTGRSADIIVNEALLEDIHSYLRQEVLSEGISTVLIVDNAGSLIVNIGDKMELDVVGLAAVAAANFAATEQIARLIGEPDFVLLFYKGHSESFHFCRVGTEYIIVTIFDNALSLGLLRLKIAEVAQVLEKKLPKREV